MALFRKSFTQMSAVSNALKETGETTIYLEDADQDLPWEKVTAVECGSRYRLSGPTSCWIIAVVDGITYKWSVDFERSSANGESVSLFDRDSLRELFRKLPPIGVSDLAELFETKVLPGLEKTTAELRSALNSQCDSEDCVRGLISYANKMMAEASP